MNGASYLKPAPIRQDTLVHVNQIIKDWPNASKIIVQSIMAVYGPPHEATISQLHWHELGPWKETIVFKEGVWHNFPQPHLDVLRQTINYRVPMERVNDICTFDGSMVVDRTRGELSVCSDSERMNIMAINLAHNIILGKLSVEEARRKFTEAAVALKLNWPVLGAQELEFSTIRDFEFQRSTADPDQQTMGGSLFKQLNRLLKKKD